MSMYQRFILIDDNEADNVFHEIMIRRAGFEGEVKVFENGVDALTFLEQDDTQSTTCIFLDINMPLMDGFEVANQLSPILASRPWVLLVMLTSSGNPADKVRAETIPAIKGFVTKPLDVLAVKDVMAGDA